MCNNSWFQAMTMAPELLESFALVASTDESAIAATGEPITKKMPMEVARIKINFFKSAFSF
ncbi:MAG TPA: hypothetical protein VF026_21495 [Ktedonobacteraceae bacterium]